MCKNNLLIQIEDYEKREYFINVLSHSEKLFQSFIPLTALKLECYGTSSDVFIEYINITFENDIINLIFFTYDTPCIEFCKRLASRYSVNIQLLYFNDQEDYSGKIDIYRHQLIKNEKCSYWQGLYNFDCSVFWENVHLIFENGTFMDILMKRGLHLIGKDFF